MRLKTILIVLVVLRFASVWPQPDKRKVTPKDYDRWSTLSGEQISPDGKWVAYSVRYKSGADTLYLQNAASGKRRSFAGAAELTFGANGRWFAVREQDKTLQVHDMQGQKTATFTHAGRYEFTPDGKYFAILSKDGTQSLTVLSAPDKIEMQAMD